MAFELDNFNDPDIHSDYLAYLVEQQADATANHYARLWDYFRNPIIPATTASSGKVNANSRPYFQAQEVGLPARITGVRRLAGGENQTDLQRKEVVIENDIAWRVQTMVDFLFGKPVIVRSLASDSELAEIIEQTITALLDANGGTAFMQEMALFGSVYGFVDIALRTPVDDKAAPPLGITPQLLPPMAAGAAVRRPGHTTGKTQPDTTNPKGDRQGLGTIRSRIDPRRAATAARKIRLETIEAPRVLPILAEDDYRTTHYWLQRFHKRPARLSGGRRNWLRTPWASRRGAAPAEVEVVEILGPSWWQRYEDGQLIAEGPNPLGRPPVVHIQNVALPGSYPGISDVEPLIPLQDELNTRLSDRAHRVTYQAFKMYLGKGIDDFLERPVGPGQMWATHNMDAKIEEFGGDDGSPGEDTHILQARQAIDKVSGVTPLAAGLIHGNVGNLTSATALKVLLSGLLARTARKRLTYGTGFRQIVAMSLEWLDLIGALPTRPEDRRVELHWSSTLPVDEGEQLRNAQIKSQLGVPTDRILAELGYDRQVIDEK